VILFQAMSVNSLSPLFCCRHCQAARWHPHCHVGRPGPRQHLRGGPAGVPLRHLHTRRV
jgi:hypothetical protein